ncbi:VOC family protein [Caballeronia novacaledonica]|uniref:VOC family protein n=1 Tax=Caballeronia novacaledonica TaxID=1544861 RepID=UPI001EE185C0|nr:VOC family protein [Caballeronia novacaledonica]GJH09281.1 VOC family protein [Caballeronia novacaledonica]
MAELPILPSGYEFHHLGYATASMAREREFFESAGYRIEGEPFEDTVQGIAGCFLTGPGPRIELLENLPGSHTLTPWLDAGIKIYHFAYCVDDIDAALTWARRNRCKVTVPPVAAVAFGGRRISFVMYRTGFMFEFIESALERARVANETEGNIQ